MPAGRPKGRKQYQLRGGVDHNDFPGREVTLFDLRHIGRSAWEKWGGLVLDHSIRDLVALAYAEGLYHGAMIGPKAMGLDTTGSSPSGDLSAAGPASSSEMITTKAPSVRDLLESL
jgi:hypothetical protein